MIPMFDFIGGPVLAGLLIVLFAAEAAWPLRRRVQSRTSRVPTNIATATTAFATMRVVQIPVALVAATMVTAAGTGVLGWLGMPAVVGGVVGFLLLDYTTYVWHRLNHRVPLLWRFHGVHHTDLDLDVTTAFRFHFGEIALSTAYRVAQVVVIGVNPALLLAYEIVLDAATEFHHSNGRLPLRLERALNRVVVTPRMHGIHHSIVERETNSNWSVVFCWWDRLHRTLRLDIPQAEITIGLPAYRDARELTFRRLMAMPFRRQRPTWRLPNGDRPDRTGAPDSRSLAA
jgi:sterol desaturase/sphingolipid hydroxylase (fatty acid hydroxylase superfamily)